MSEHLDAAIRELDHVGRAQERHLHDDVGTRQLASQIGGLTRAVNALAAAVQLLERDNEKREEVRS